MCNLLNIYQSLTRNREYVKKWMSLWLGGRGYSQNNTILHHVSDKSVFVSSVGQLVECQGVDVNLLASQICAVAWD